MTSQQLLQPPDREGFDRSSFSSIYWLNYFERNKREKRALNWPQKVDVPYAISLPIVKSLQCFQVGETGEGTHLRYYAKALNDPDYEQCIDLFIKEENAHAVVLARMIELMKGHLITWHWSDYAFVSLRHLIGLKTEIFMILAVEIVGKCFYQSCSEGLPDEFLRNTFAAIVLDEIGHLKFHWNFMHQEMRPLSKWSRTIIYYFCSAVFLAICLVFIADHGRALLALNKSKHSFLKDCLGLFKRGALRALFVK
ncbi:hypothetical protein BH11CYA1_BH11CYA1_23870 [soil metagenome]